MEKMLAFVDGSIYSESVCDHTLWLAQKNSSKVSIFNVMDERETSHNTANFSGNLIAEARNNLLSELAELDNKRAKLAQKKGRLILDDAEARLIAGGLKTIDTHLRHGDFVDTVTEFQEEADILVIGKRGEAANFAKLHLGSNLERLIRSANKPVLVAARIFRPIKKILIGFDGGKSAVRAIEHVSNQDLFEDLECHLLSAGKIDVSQKKKIEAAERSLSEKGRKTKTFVKEGDAETVISNHVEQHNIDLLVMGAYGHSRIRNLMIGSTTTQMIRSCQIPVLLFR
jgi:nucleotide-binding universal stress UspA family protein